MNERIRELNHMAMSIVLNGDDPDRDVDRMYIPSEFTKKFAELIVKECAQVCRDQPNVFAMKLDRENCAIAIEEHFGVEE